MKIIIRIYLKYLFIYFFFTAKNFIQYVGNKVLNHNSFG